MSKTRSLHHIVFTTKYRKNTIPEEHKRQLYLYIYGILKKKSCFVHRINGIGDHIHILVDLHPAVALANLVKDMKVASNNWLKTNPNFPLFEGWADKYYAFSIGVEALDNCRQYIINQEQHHLHTGTSTEIDQMLGYHGLSIDD